MFKKFFLLLIFVLLFTGCNAPIIKKSPELTVYENMVNRSLLFEGNTYRTKEKLQKAKKGEKVVVAYLGGSITEGFGIDESKNYAQLSFRKLINFLGENANLEYINLGVDGTNSIFGNTIADKEIFSKKADIILIEYAVDDKPEQKYREAFESLIRTCLKNENNPAVILIITCNDKGVSRQDFMIQLGKYYNLPVIAVANAVEPEISASRMKPEEYFLDNIHPTEYGHRLMSDFIMNYLKKAYKSKLNKDFEVPQRMFPKSVFENVKFLSAKTLSADNDGSFIRKDLKDGKIFKNSIEYLSNTGNLPFEFTINANNIFIVAPTYKSETSNADIYINGEKTSTISLKNENGTDAPNSFLIYSSDKQVPVKVSIKVLDDESNKTNYAELENKEENSAPSEKNDDNNISEINVPLEEKVIQIKKKTKVAENTIPFSFYGIGYTKNSEAKK